MRETIKQRLHELEAEREAGQRMLAELDQKRQNLAQTVLRIEGAIQVLHEVLDSEKQAGIDRDAQPVARA